MIMRIVFLVGAMTSGLLVASCSSLSGFVADTLPAWAGGLPEGTPPRPGSPGYDAYLKSVNGNEPARTDPGSAKPDNPPPRKAGDPIDDPVH
jgi:hypothetical protein